MTIRELVERYADDSVLNLICLRMQKLPDRQLDDDERTMADLRLAFAFAGIALPPGKV